ncbi:MAG: hypothetical protein U0X75_18360 [Acidobacteriota bacterium]
MTQFNIYLMCGDEEQTVEVYGREVIPAAGEAIKSNVGQSVLAAKKQRTSVNVGARYVDDLTFPDMLYGATVRLPIARGRLRGVQFGEGIPGIEFTIVTAKDVPGANCVVDSGRPALPGQRHNQSSRRTDSVAGTRRQIPARKSALAVSFDIEPLPALFSIEDSLNQKAHIWGAKTTSSNRF